MSTILADQKSIPTTQPQSITIENVGPIAGTFEIEIDGPGAYVLMGDKGSGKSTVIKCVEHLAGHNVDLTVHDGELAGSVKGFGVVAPIGSRKRPRGDFELNALDSERFSISDITDPQGKTADVRDANRIKALASLCKMTADPEQYWDLVGGQAAFESLVPPEKLQTDDPVLLASRVKEAFEAAARLVEGTAQNERGHWESALEQSKLAGSDEPYEAGPLNAAVDAAVAHETGLRERKKGAEAAARSREEARRKLDLLTTSYRGPKATEAREAQKLAEAAARESAEECSRLKKLLDEAIAKNKDAVAAANLARQTTVNAMNHENLVAEFSAILDQNSIEPPTAGEIADASVAVTKARAAQERGTLIRAAMEANRRAVKHQANEQAATARAEFLRSAAKGTFDVLTSSVKIAGLRIESPNGSPRLVVGHKRKPKTLYDELSDGERVRNAMTWLAPLIQAPGIFPVSQRLWQDLPPKDRQEIDAEAKRLKLIVIGAQVSEGALRVERCADE